MNWRWEDRIFKNRRLKFNLTSKDLFRMSTQAEQLRSEADKLEASKGGFFSKLFGGGSDKLEEACDLYTRAGSRFKGN